MKFNVAKVVGLNTDQEAAQALYSSSDSSNYFFSVLKLVCDDAFTKGRQLLSETADLYFQSEGAPAEKLNLVFNDLEEKLSKEGGYDLLLAIISGKVLYLIPTGKVVAILKRVNELSLLNSDASAKQLISGFLEEGDKILLTTKAFETFLGDDLTKTLELPLNEWEEEMNSKVGVADLSNDGLAAALIYVEDEQQIPIPKSTPYQADKRSDTEKKSFDIKSVITALLSKVSVHRQVQEGEQGQEPGYGKKTFILTRFIPKSGKTRLILALIILLILAVGAILQYKREKDNQNNILFNQLLQSARDDYNAALGLQTLNPNEAGNKLTSAKDNVNKALAIKPNEPQALNLKNEIDTNSNNILQKFESSQLPLFLDLGLIKEGFLADKMTLSVGKLLLLDTTNKSLVVVDLAQKSQQIISGKERLGDATHASINGDFAFVYSPDKGVIKVDITNQKTSTVAKVDKGLGIIADIAGFASNVYILDIGSNQIWKYVPTSAGYSDKRVYLNKDVKADFVGTLRMQIESSIYILKQGGEILRFTKGASDFFSIGGLDKGVKDPKSIFVSSDTENLYVLDSGNSRLVVLSKTGAYKSQYQGDKFATASDLVVDEKGKKVYLLEGSKIYFMDLK